MEVEKRIFPGLDLLKFICSIAIVFLHINPFPEPIYFITKAIGNLGVPCFFIISGFLLFRKLYIADQNEQVRIWGRQIKRLAILLGFWLIVYFLICDFWWIREGNIPGNLLDYVKRILFGGSVFFLWYVVSLMVGLTIVFFLWRWIGVKFTLVIAGVLFLAGTIPFAYQPLIAGSWYETVFLWYQSLFCTTRNGLFFAFPCLSLGMLLAKGEPLITQWCKKVYWLLSLAVALFAGESAFVYFVFHSLVSPMQFSAIILSLVLVIAFLLIPKNKIKASLWMRKMSFLIYVIHPLWLTILPKALSLATSWNLDYYWYYYWGVQIPIVLILTILTGWLLILCSKKISLLKNVM